MLHKEGLNPQQNSTSTWLAQLQNNSFTESKKYVSTKRTCAIEEHVEGVRDEAQ
jgi:hypothetical protein